jgi:hypothetical protein
LVNGYLLLVESRFDIFGIQVYLGSISDIQ